MVVVLPDPAMAFIFIFPVDLIMAVCSAVRFIVAS